MTFGAPSYLWLMLLVPVCAAAAAGWLVWRVWARRRFGGIEPEPALAKVALVLSPVLLVAAIAMAAFAAARPQFGNATGEAERRGIDVVIVLDVSNSMQATDVEPSRLVRAQRQLDQLLDRMAGDRAGIVIFAGAPLVRSPITSDLTVLRGILRGVDGERGLLAPGSNVGLAVDAGLELLARSETRSRVMLLVSDGEDFGASLNGPLSEAERANIRIYTAGAGTAEGAPVIDTDPETGAVSPRIEGGQPVITRLDEASLRSIAQATGGRYIAPGDGGGIADLAAEFDGLASTAFGTEESTRPIERFQVFAAIALLLADVELMLLAIPRRAGRRIGPLAKLWPVAGSAVFIGAVCGTTVADVNDDGNAAFVRGEYQAALDLYRTAQAQDPRAEFNYNAANALAQLGQHEAAIEEALRGRNAEPTLAAAIEYSLGSHYANAGRLVQALEAYKNALFADPADEDAKHNLEVVTIRLTPSPTPTMPVPEGPTPVPGGEDPGGGPPGGDPGAQTPPADADPSAGTPDPSAEAPPLEQLTPEELQRALEEALAGINREFTEEEAMRLLDLLNEQNRRNVEENAGAGPQPGLPDY